MTRPQVLVGVAGTATEVGKTWVSAAVLAELRRRGVSVAARKPLQSFDPLDPHPRDADVLAAATGESPDVVCASSASFPVPMAPPMAADVLGRPRPTTADVLAGVAPEQWPTDVAVGVVETVGGVASPMTATDHSAGVLARLKPDVVVLVADAGLGTIDAVRTSVAYLAVTDVIVVLNRFDPAHDLHQRNRAWLAADGFVLVTTVAGLADQLIARTR